MSEHVPTARFPTTCWSRIALAADPASAGTREAMATLCMAYWFPVYAFIRRKGHMTEEAHDLTQEFFAVLLDTDSLASVDRARGRFRSFLLAACTHFLSNVRDHDRALKRGGGRPPISIDARDAETRFGNEPAHEDTPSGSSTSDGRSPCSSRSTRPCVLPTRSRARVRSSRPCGRAWAEATVRNRRTPTSADVWV